MLLIPCELRPSIIHGIGLFCRESVAKDQKVWEFHPLFDFALDESQVAHLPKVAQAFIETYGYRAAEHGKLMINLDLSRHMNHADTPCLYSDADSNYFAAWDLAAGTELTCDYREFCRGGCSDFLSQEK